MTSQKRVMKSLNFQIPDRIPIGRQSFWSEFVEKWRQKKKLSKEVNINDIVSLTQGVNFDLKRTRIFLQFYEKSAKLSSEERKLLPWFIRARWLNCRVDGMRKVSEKKKVSFLLKDIFKPLNSLEKIKNEFI